MKTRHQASKSKSHLHGLIKSLSKSEKRYFKIYLKRNAQGENSASEKLFDAIDQQESYDEKKLKGKFKQESFARNFSVAKNRLTENILRALHFYHHQKSKENTFNTLLNEIEILYSKSLKGLCIKKYRQANELALFLNDPIKILRLEKWRNKLEISSLSDEDNYQEALNTLRLESELNDLLKDLRKKQLEKDSLSLAVLKLHSILEENLLHRRVLKKTHRGLSHLYYLQQNFTMSLDHAQKALKVLNDNEIEEQIHLISNIIYLAVKVKQFDKAKTKLFELRMLQKDFGHLPPLKPKFLEAIANLDLFIKTSEKRIQDALEAIPPIAKELAYYNGEIDHKKRASFYLNFAQIYFLKSEFKSALKWSNELINYKALELHSDLYLHGLLFNLILHSELGNHAYNSHRLKFVEQTFEKAGSIGRFEEQFFQYIDKEEINFEQWQRDFLKLPQNEREKSIVLNFEFEKWLEAKVKKVDLIYLI